MEKLIVFDFDGVIVNSVQPFIETMRLIMPNFTLDDARNMLTGNLFDKKNQHIFNLVKEKSIDLYGIYANKIAEIPPNLGLVKMMTNEAVDKIIVVSSMNENIIEDYLNKYDIRKYFGEIMGAKTDKSKEVKIEKIKALNPNREIFFVTDTSGDIIELKNTNIKIIAVTWGYHTKEMLIETMPDWIVNTPGELWQILR
jgi:phosphoglycolate phosphatase